ncbi:MAG: flavodoxin family protein [Anaerolineae bacterium]
MTEQRILVVFHSSSGNTKKVAEAVAARLSADLEQIRERDPHPVDIKGKGFGNFLNMGRAVMGGKSKRAAEIEDAQYNPADYDLMIVGTPVYANTLPAATRAYLETYADRLPQVAFFCTGEDPNNRHIFELMATASDKQPVAWLPFHAPQVREGTFASRVEEFLTLLPTGNQEA